MNYKGILFDLDGTLLPMDGKNSSAIISDYWPKP